MVMERIRAAGKDLKNHGPLQQKGLELIKHIMRTHKIKDPGPKEQPARKSSKAENRQPIELNLAAEWQRQASRFVELGYHSELGLTEAAYLESLPRFKRQPKEYRGRFDAPMLVEVRIPWEKQAQLAGIDVSEYLVARIDQTNPCDERSETPEVPYAGWFSKWGQEFPNKIKPFDARNQLAADAVGGSPFEGVAQQVHHPEVTEGGKYFDLIGYKVGSDYVPCLDRWYGRPELDAHWGDGAYGYFRPLVRGKKIVTRQLAS
ncbi:MAG: hypothetical protein UU23_C0004G0057 [Candidatus Curtissbacteria bacterium GW2011_GWA1_40_9]|uniref:Uncharacterized protein n=1 Tax=Candidatus Curtissbacteria bacterium GW2011_GWA1_40_9 TaxID=1618408 RepID=A0A0G0W163_9BACT|nr:MAG: hypothetical protein UU23_C0004G0057 [Candidatus Curtissbacteria bacterium GW2011_GWA1_40_9]